MCQNIPQSFVIGKANWPIKWILVSHHTEYLFIVVDVHIGCALKKITV